MSDEYLDSLHYVRHHGNRREDRTGTGTLSVFGGWLSFDLEEGFPLLTTKKIWWRGVVEELRWFLSGSTNVNDLAESVQKWWTHWARDDGELGPTYGEQFRRQGPSDFDQLSYVLDLINNQPTSRRILMSLWNTADMLETGLPCCHGTVVQFYVLDGKLSCHMYQRSADIFIGVPVNIASYALLTHMIAAACGLGVGRYSQSFGDLHLYLNHQEQADLQLSREAATPPSLKIHKPANWDSMSSLERILCLDYDMLEVVDYHPMPAIKAPISV